jgi:two-component system chemotaxis response regulator CheB
MDAVQGSPTSASEVAAAAEPLQSATRNIVVVGASAGGVKALRGLLSGLPANYGGSIFVVMHISPDSRSELPSILTRDSALPTVHAEDGMAIETGRVYVAPPDQHLLVEHEHMLVVHGPRENRHRPAIDPLFRSAAWTYGPRVVGVVLTGNLDDGTAGLWAIKSCGGTTIVQEPEQAAHPQMPLNALMHNRVDHRLKLKDIATLLDRLAREPIGHRPVPAPPTTLRDEIEFAKMKADIRDIGRLGQLSAFTCPACRGALWELEEGGHLRYRCHTGHAYTQDSLLVDQTLAVEDSVYTALRAVEEKATALRRLASRWPEQMGSVRQDYETRALELERSADVLRAMLAGAVA